MNLNIIILSIGLILAVLFLIKNKDRINISIVGIQITAFVFALFSLPSIGFYLFGIAILIVFIYSFSCKEIKKRICLWIFLISCIIVFVSTVLHLPWNILFDIFVLVSVCSSFIYSIMNRDLFKKEISFMILFLANVLTQLISPFLNKL